MANPKTTPKAAPAGPLATMAAALAPVPTAPAVLTTAQQAQAAAAAAALALQPTLPRSLQAQYGTPAPAIAPTVGGVLYVAGKPFACRSHNAVWAAAVMQALQNGPQTYAALCSAAANALPVGSPRGGGHSITAYVKRGNLVRHTG